MSENSCLNLLYSSFASSQEEVREGYQNERKWGEGSNEEREIRKGGKGTKEERKRRK